MRDREEARLFSGIGVDKEAARAVATIFDRARLRGPAAALLRLDPEDRDEAYELYSKNAGWKTGGPPPPERRLAPGEVREILHENAEKRRREDASRALVARAVADADARRDAKRARRLARDKKSEENQS